MAEPPVGRPGKVEPEGEAKVMKSYRIAMVPGDGVGPEVSLEAERVLIARG